MELTCPHCGYAKSLEMAQLPVRPSRVTCPKCRERFLFSQSVLTDPPAPEGPPTDAASAGAKREDGYDADSLARLQEFEPLLTTRALPKAGFWVRVVATIIDSLLLGMIQMVLTMVLHFAADVSSQLSGGGHIMVATLTWLFGIALSFAYYTFFTGYCGQTPGKMAIRVKVVRTDGGAVDYSKAFMREVLGKFVSGILFGIGYLMVAFDDQKQGLHDKIAETYVIKL